VCFADYGFDEKIKNYQSFEKYVIILLNEFMKMTNFISLLIDESFVDKFKHTINHYNNKLINLKKATIGSLFGI